jgi:hypothetical protein
VYRRLIEWTRRSPIMRGARSWIEPETRRKIVRTLRGRDRSATVNDALAGRAANMDDIEAYLVSRLRPLHVPLILISQAHRSGGTLLSQLFDGHPALAAHPHELKIGHPTAEEWPSLDPALGPEKNFRMLFEPRTIRFLRNGYIKGERASESLACFNVPKLQYESFMSLFRSSPPSDQRAILDYYFTAYFSAWLNYQGTLDEKQLVTAFAPRFAYEEASVTAYFDCYPDGRLIQIVRDPKTWYPSAKHHEDRGSAQPEPEEILQAWCQSAESIVRNKARFGDRVIVLRFEDLIGKIEPTMRYLARDLSIAFHPILLEPTFNGQAIRANSSFAVEQSGVIIAPLTRANMLSEAERQLIEGRCRGLYESALGPAAVIAA